VIRRVSLCSPSATPSQPVGNCRFGAGLLSLFPAAAEQDPDLPSGSEVAGGPEVAQLNGELAGDPIAAQQAFVPSREHLAVDVASHCETQSAIGKTGVCNRAISIAEFVDVLAGQRRPFGIVAQPKPGFDRLISAGNFGLPIARGVHGHCRSGHDNAGQDGCYRQDVSHDPPRLPQHRCLSVGH